MAIILDNLTSEQFEELRRNIASLDDAEQRLEAMRPFTEYRYVEELLDDTEWRTRLEAAERERDSYRQRYIDRFFSGTGLEDKEIEQTREIDEEEKNDSAKALNPETFDELYEEE